MRRLTRGRAATDDEGTPQATAASEPVDAAHDAQPGGASLPAHDGATTPADEPATAVLPQATTAPVQDTAPDVDRDLPAGVDPGELAAAPSAGRRGRLRHRLRYLRAVRELLLRDIGGFYYEAQRSEDGVEPHQRLLDAKTARLTKLDDEVRDLEGRLDEPHPETTVLRVPGLGGTCPECGELYGSDARFCSRCGSPLGRRAATAAPPAAAPAASTGEAKQTTASLWGRPKRPAVDEGGDATVVSGETVAAQEQPRVEEQESPAVEERESPAVEERESPAVEERESPAVEERENPAVEEPATVTEPATGEAPARSERS